MKILCTGSNGFIGKHVVKALRETEHEVIAADNEWLNLKWNESMDMEADITKPLIPIPGLDAVIHLAGLANPRECDVYPGSAFDKNVNGTHQVLKMALASGAKKVVYASTAHVYGVSPKYLPTDETHPLWLQNNYTLTKILGEQLCELYYQNHGLSYTVLRLYNAYGPGQARGYFIPDMLAKARKGNIVLTGGNTTKDWVYVEEVAQAFVKALGTPFVGHINIGTGVETEISVLAEYIARAMGASFSSTPDPNATRMQADTSRAREVLSWQPVIGVVEGLERLLQAEGIKTNLVPVMDWK